MFSQIHEIVFYGNGGYDWETVYKMPIWLRKFTYEKLKKHYEDKKEEQDKVNNQLSNKPPKDKVNQPNISNYTAKAPKK